MTETAFILESIRTPRGKGKNGALHKVSPLNLVTGLIKEISYRQPQLDMNQINDLLLGIVTPKGEQGANLARTAAIATKLTNVPGFQLNRFCASSLETVNLAAAKVATDWEQLILAGGVESMSRVPMGSDGGPMFLDVNTNYDSYFIPQGISADLIATLERFTREQLDNFALNSQQKAHQALLENRFKPSLVAVKDQNQQLILSHDEHPRATTTLTDLTMLKPAFSELGNYGGFDFVATQKYLEVENINHLHTAGNSSGIVDGASLLLIGNEKSARTHQLTPRARIVATATVAGDPTIMLTQPVPAIKKVLKRAGLKKTDIDLREINEAFAAVVLKTIRDLDIDPEKVNPNGGAIALGHPLGATGGILLGTQLDELARTNQRYGLTVMCVAGGMAVATIIERL